MTVNEIVLDAIQQLPTDISCDDVLEQVTTLAAIERGQQAASEGRTIPQAEFQHQALQWTIK